MENTIENKEKFFGLYWRQNVLCHDILEEKNRSVNVKHFLHGDYLQLTPLSQITDEERDHCIKLGKGYSQSRFNSEQADYLRSLSYAIPYMGLSVEQQIDYGWVKLKTE